MILTEEQRHAVEHPGHALVVACPGSGKTRAIIAKLLRAVNDVRDSPRRVACITYTNAAVHEIEGRIALYGATGDEDYCEVATIHSFCQNNILRHFHWRVAEYAEGFTILPSDSDRFGTFADQIASKYELSSFARQQFEQLNRAPDGSPITPDEIPAQAALEFWALLQEHRFIDFCNVVYFSFRLLAENPTVTRLLSAQFKHILVDEFQDTSAIQVEILKLINGTALTTFFLVGDPEQSIYSFAGANRELMFTFASHIDATEFPLSGNFRCSTPVIRCAEALIPRTPAMYAAGPAAAFTDEPYYEHVQDAFAGITDNFLPALEALAIPFGQSAILAPNWFLLRPLGRKLREYGIPVVGPGARPYKRSHLFARLAEHVCAYVDSPRPQFIRPIEAELFQLVANLTGRADFRIFTFNGRRVLFRLLQAAVDLRLEHESAVPWLRTTARHFGDILFEEGLIPTAGIGLLPESADALIQDMVNAQVDVANLALADLGMFANPESNLKLLTIHQAKGREFRAVALIGLHDGVIPFHNKYKHLSTDDEAEARRLMYVALTRAERLLHLYTTADNWRPICRFLPLLCK